MPYLLRTMKLTEADSFYVQTYDSTLSDDFPVPVAIVDLQPFFHFSISKIARFFLQFVSKLFLDFAKHLLSVSKYLRFLSKKFFKYMQPYTHCCREIVGHILKRQNNYFGVLYENLIFYNVN